MKRKFFVGSCIGEIYASDIEGFANARRTLADIEKELEEIMSPEDVENLELEVMCEGDIENEIWQFPNGVKVTIKEKFFNEYCFVVCKNDEWLGNIFPYTMYDMWECIEKLDNGKDPITDEWEDGCGNVCNEKGWWNHFHF